MHSEPAAPSQHIFAMTCWQAQLRGVRALQSLPDGFLSAPVQQRGPYFLAVSMQCCFLCAVEVLLVEELRGFSFGSGIDNAWGWEV